MLDVVSCGLDIYMLELKLFHGKNKALNGLEKLVNTKEVPLKIFSAGNLGKFYEIRYISM